MLVDMIYVHELHFSGQITDVTFLTGPQTIIIAGLVPPTPLLCMHGKRIMRCMHLCVIVV